MTKKFHKELSDLKHEVETMANLARKMLKKAVQALKDRDEELADWVLSKKGHLADLDNNIEARSLHLLTLYQPMASDLRTLACILKLITYLNRIGRYGKDIAKIVKEIADKPHISKLVSIPYMAEIVDSMVADAIKAFEENDLGPIKDIAERDDKVDTLRYSIFREVISYMIEDPKYIMRGTHYVMVARYLERCADHACKMAEKINYMVTGKHIDIEGKGDMAPSATNDHGENGA